MKRIKPLLDFGFLGLLVLALGACSNDARSFGYEAFTGQNTDMFSDAMIQSDEQYYQGQYFENADEISHYDDNSVDSVAFSDNLAQIFNYHQAESSAISPSDEYNGITTSSLKRKSGLQLASSSKDELLNDLTQYKIVVEDGDTLYSLAKNHGYTITELARANELTSPYTINVGQELLLPSKQDQASSFKRSASNKQSSKAASGNLIHTVAKGENLFRISLKYGIKLQSLADHNQISNVESLRVGQNINIPTAGYAPKTSLVTAKNVTLRSDDSSLKADRTAAIVKKRQRKVTAKSKMRWPVSGRIIRVFSLKEGDKNEGINILAPYGTGVRAADSGEVVYADDKLRGYGNLILIRHSDKIVTAYAYNSKMLVKKGVKVKRGQIIAHVGSTGSVNRPQLHFEVRKGSLAVNPLLYLAKK